MRPKVNFLPNILFPGILSEPKLDTATKYTLGPVRPLANQTLGWLRTNLYSIEYPLDRQPLSVEEHLSYDFSDDIPLSNSNVEKHHMSVAEVPFVTGADEYEDNRFIMPCRKAADRVGRQRRTGKGGKLPSRPIETIGKVIGNRGDYEAERAVGPNLDNHTKSDHDQASKQHQLRRRGGSERQGQPERSRRAYKSSRQLEKQEQANRATEREPSGRVVDMELEFYQHNYGPRLPSVILHENNRRIDTNLIPEMLDPRNQFSHGSARLAKASRSGADWEKDGFVFVIPEKVRISPDKQQDVERDMQEALKSNMFNLWPTFEDDRQSWYDIRSGMDVDKKAAKNNMRASGLYMREQEGEMGRRKEELLKAWKEKDERKRDPGGWESESENRKLTGLDWFKPTLRDNPRRARTPTEAELDTYEAMEKKKKPGKMIGHKDAERRRKERNSVLDEKRLAEGKKSSASGSSRSSTSSDSRFLIQK